MDRIVAEALMGVLLSLDGPLNAAAALSEKVSDSDERKRLKNGLGGVAGRIYVDLMVPILKQYPDLDPERSRTSESLWKSQEPKESQ